MSESKPKEKAPVVPAVREPAPPQPVLMPVVSPTAMIEQHEAIVQLIGKVLKKEVDYGEIPGTNRRGNKQKLVLLKPGAERLCLSFGIRPEFEIIEQEKDHDRVNNFIKKQWNDQTRRKEEVKGTSYGLYRFVLRCTLYTVDGRKAGQGLGSCSTMEAKYVDRPRDLENTVLKMARKRAHVDATINALGLSNRFDQDLEDYVDQPEAQQKNPNGFDPNDEKHVAWIQGQLEEKGVPPGMWTAIGEKLKGRPSSELDKAIDEVNNGGKT